MDIGNVMVALASDRGNSTPKFSVTPAEIAVLRAIHGEDAVFDIEPIGEVERSSRQELERLNNEYGRSRAFQSESLALSMLFPGAGATVFETFDELGLPDEFYKPLERATPAPKVTAAQKRDAKKRVTEAAESRADDASETPPAFS